MVKLIFVDYKGNETLVEAELGQSVMEAAKKQEVAGILAQCGGACACATCHVIIDDAFTDKIPQAGESEIETLDFIDEPMPNSRLSCQITVTNELDGVRFVMPESQV